MSRFLSVYDKYGAHGPNGKSQHSGVPHPQPPKPQAWDAKKVEEKKAFEQVVNKIAKVMEERTALFDVYVGKLLADDAYMVSDSVAQ